jgi:hypothetical protein
MDPVSANNAADRVASRKSLSEKLAFWIGIVGSLVTIILTVINTYTKKRIDDIESSVKQHEVNIKQQAADLEVARSRLEAYKWVFGLVSSLDDKDKTKKTVTANMIRLALTKQEQEQFFTGLQSSSDKRLQDLGQSGIAAIQSEEVASLVSSLNAPEIGSRKKAAAVLQQNYTSSPIAIELVLRLYDEDAIKGLSPDGLINGLYYLNRTEPTAWNAELVTHGKAAIAQIKAQKPGQKTQSELNNFDKLLTNIQGEAKTR